MRDHLLACRPLDRRSTLTAHADTTQRDRLLYSAIRDTNRLLSEQYRPFCRTLTSAASLRYNAPPPQRSSCVCDRSLDRPLLLSSTQQRTHQPTVYDAPLTAASMGLAHRYPPRVVTIPVRTGRIAWRVTCRDRLLSTTPYWDMPYIQFNRLVLPTRLPFQFAAGIYRPLFPISYSPAT